MSASRNLCRIGIALLLVPAWLGTSTEANAAEFDRVVQAGAISPTDPDRPYEYSRYYPETLQIHRGQTVRWTFIGSQPILGFHTVTFSDQGRPAMFREDEVPGTYAFPERTFFGSGCGRGTQPACVLDAGTAFVSSGAPPLAPEGSPFRVTFDLAPGTYHYFCTFHPTMEGTVEVVPDIEPIPSQDDIDTMVEQQIDDDTRAADARWDAGPEPASTVEGGTRVWRVLLGDATDDDHVTIASYLPSTLEVQPGDAVRFRYRDRPVGPIINELHTATFPAEVGVQALGVTFVPACDPDGPSSGAIGAPGIWGFAGPTCPFTTELLWQVRMTRQTPAPGNAVLTSATYHDSGLLVPPGAPDSIRRLPDHADPLPSTFDAVLPVEGVFAFGCSIHETTMTGSVTVTAT